MAKLTTDLSARLSSGGIYTRWMTIRGFANSSSVPPLPSFSERHNRDSPSARPPLRSQPAKIASRSGIPTISILGKRCNGPPSVWCVIGNAGRMVRRCRPEWLTDFPHKRSLRILVLHGQEPWEIENQGINDAKNPPRHGASVPSPTEQHHSRLAPDGRWPSALSDSVGCDICIAALIPAAAPPNWFSYCASASAESHVPIPPGTSPSFTGALWHPVAFRTLQGARKNLLEK